MVLLWFGDWDPCIGHPENNQPEAKSAVHTKSFYYDFSFVNKVENAVLSWLTLPVADPFATRKNTWRWPCVDERRSNAGCLFRSSRPWSADRLLVDPLHRATLGFAACGKGLAALLEHAAVNLEPAP